MDKELLRIVKEEIPYKKHDIPSIESKTTFRVVAQESLSIEAQKRVFFELSGLARTEENENKLEELSRHLFGNMLTIIIIAELIREKGYELFEIADEILSIKIKIKEDNLSAVLPLCKLFEMAGLSEDHKDILFYMSLFCENGLSYGDVLNGVREKGGSVNKKHLDELIAYGFVKKRTDECVFLPSLVSDLSFYCFGAGRDDLFEKAATDLKKKWQEIGSDSVWLLKEKRAYFLHMLYRLAYNEKYEDLIDMYCSWVGRISIILYDYAMARKYYKKSYDLCKKQVIVTHTAESKKNYADSCSRMGYICDIEDDIQHAKAFFEEAYLIRKELMETLKTVQSENDFSSSCDDLGCLYLEIGVFSKAKEYLETAYAIDERHMNEPQYTRYDESAFAISCTHLGDWYFETKDPIKAKEYFDRALVIRKKSMGLKGTLPAKNGYADCCKKIGDVYYLWNDYPKVKEYYGQAYPIYEMLMEEKGTPEALESYAVACDYLGLALKEERDFEKAKDFFEKGYDAAKKMALVTNCPEEDYEVIAVFCRSLADVYERMGNLPLAKEFYTKAFLLCQKRIQKAHTEKSNDLCVEVCQELARVLYYKYSDYQGALPCSETRYAITKESLKGERNSKRVLDHIRSCEFLGNVYMKLLNLKKAKRYYKEGCKLGEKWFKRSTKPDMIRAYAVIASKVGDVYMEEKAYKKAKKYYRISYLRAMGLERDLETPQSRKEYAAFSYKMAQVCQKLGESEDAQGYMHTYYFYR